MSREAKILVGIVLIITIGMVALFMLGGGSDTATPGPKVDANKLVNAASHKTDTGTVTVVEFGDYECPACGQAYPITKKLMNDYQGKITFVFRNFPLPMHKDAKPAAQAAEAAAMQNKFWEMHDKLYEHQTDWAEKANAEDLFVGYAKELGLDVEKFNQDRASEAVKKIIEADLADGNAISIQATPTFYVNGAKSDSYDYDALKGLIDSAVKK